MYSAPRAATVRSTAPCKLWVAERAVVNTIKRHFVEKVAQTKLDLLEHVPMMRCLTEGHKQMLANALDQVLLQALLARKQHALIMKTSWYHVSHRMCQY